MDFVALTAGQERLLELCTEHYDAWREVWELATGPASEADTAAVLAERAAQRWRIRLSSREARELIRDLRVVRQNDRARLLQACAESPDRWNEIYALADPEVAEFTRIEALRTLCHGWGLDLGEADALWFFRAFHDADVVRGASTRAT